MFKYKTFRNSKEFEEWQTDKIKIYQFTPIALDMDINADAHTTYPDYNAQLNFGIFIVYSMRE